MSADKTQTKARGVRLELKIWKVQTNNMQIELGRT